MPCLRIAEKRYMQAMIQNLTTQEIQNAVDIMQKYNGIDFIYSDNNKSRYIFNFTKNTSEIIFDNSKGLEVKDKLNNVSNWNLEITIKIAHLRNTFIYLNSFYNRYLQTQNSKDQQYFRYFAEIISYYFISIRDIMLHLINVFIDNPIKLKHKVDFKKIRKHLVEKNSPILEALDDFENKTERFREDLRNSFTHNLNPFIFYEISEINIENSLSINYSNSIANEEFRKVVIENFEYLSSYIEKLRELFK